MMFVTATVLDLVHAFRRDEPRDEMVRIIARESRLAEARLHAYVVMSHHVHLVIHLSKTMDIRKFMQRLKPNAGRSISRLLTSEDLAEFDAQHGLNSNTFWQRSFRSVEIVGDNMLEQKLDYIHQNPVKAEYVVRPEEYRWSSARLFEQGLWSAEKGLPFEAVAESVVKPD